MKKPYIYLLVAMLFASAVLAVFAYQHLAPAASVARVGRGLK
jgi:hypothetical protein